MMENKAFRILSGKKLSKRFIEWDVPADLLKHINRENHFETYVSIGEWKNNKEKFILICQEGKLIYLEEEIIKKLTKKILTQSSQEARR